MTELTDEVSRLCTGASSGSVESTASCAGDTVYIQNAL